MKYLKTIFKRGENILEKEIKLKIDCIIDEVIQKELKYQTHFITNDGWTFLEESAKDLIFNKIENDDLDEEEILVLKITDFEQYLADVISDYEELNAPIRVNSLWK